MTDAPMFTAADRLTLFTKETLQARLGDTCTVDWFVVEFKLTKRCKGRIIAGADILKALENPPAEEAHPAIMDGKVIRPRGNRERLTKEGSPSPKHRHG